MYAKVALVTEHQPGHPCLIVFFFLPNHFNTCRHVATDHTDNFYFFLTIL